MSQKLSEEQTRQIVEALARDAKIEAIKLYREFTGKGLKDAKAFVEQPISSCDTAEPARPAERRVVNNRVFLLGLDDLYRMAMKRHEKEELLQCARDTARVLGVGPADVPVEGYYSEDATLTEYFLLMRTLQDVPGVREAELRSVAGYSRLKSVAGSRIFGRSSGRQSLLPGGKDPFSVALEKTFPEWNIANLINSAYEIALASDDVSLVGLAALSRDPVVLAALRESVVLYAMIAVGASMDKSKPEYVWAVDADVYARAREFVKLFNDLFGNELPEPGPENAEIFWNACKEWTILGRCVRLGVDIREPVRHYHWAIDRDPEYHLVVKDFWDTELWTTSKYREKHMVHRFI